MGSTGKRLRRRVLAATATMALGVGLLYGLSPIAGVASSHREAPLISGDPQVDATDLYAFVSPDDANTVTFVSSWIPFEEPAGGPNFYPWANGARYDINVDNNGDAKADITFRWYFTEHRRGGGNSFLYNNGPVTSLTDDNLLYYQTYDLERITINGKGKKVTRELAEDVIAVPSNVGDASMPNFEALSDSGVASCGAGCSTWAGQSDDPFFLDLRVFDLLYGLDLTEVGDDTLAGFNVNTMALRVPKGDVAAGGDAAANPIIGVWSTASRRTLDGRWVQVSRLGMPLVNEVVIPVKDKDLFNASKPKNDGQFLSYVTDPEVPKLIDAIYGIPAPATPRNDLVAVFLTGVDGLNQPAGVTPSEELRLNMSIDPDNEGCATYSRLGVIGGDICGFPNGRRLADDTIDIALQVVEGFLVGQETGLGDGVPTNDVPFLDHFPYVGYAHSGSDPDPH